MTHEFTFTWGDGVRVRADAPAPYRRGAVGDVCGMRLTGGVEVYTVEYEDGSDHEIELRWLERE